MTTKDIIIQIFCAVDDQIGAVAKVSQAILYPSEVVTLGILFARTAVSDSCWTHSIGQRRWGGACDPGYALVRLKRWLLIARYAAVYPWGVAARLAGTGRSLSTIQPTPFVVSWHRFYLLRFVSHSKSLARIS